MIARVQAFFVQHQDAHFKRLRAHFFELVDNRPNTTRAQNLRTAGVMLDKQDALFGRAFQAALRESVEDEVEAVMPGAMAVLRPVSDDDDHSGPSSMALLDVDEIERHLLVDRVAQRFNSRYESQLKALTASVGALLRQEDFALVDNPFRPASLVRAFLIAWHSSAFDPMAAEDFVSVIEPDCTIDWTPLYNDLTAMLVRAGYSATAGASHQAHGWWRLGRRLAVSGIRSGHGRSFGTWRAGVGHGWGCVGSRRIGRSACCSRGRAGRRARDCRACQAVPAKARFWRRRWC